MATFSMGQAIGSGFRLIGRQPKTILIWIAAYVVFAAAFYGLMFAAMPELLGYYQEVGRSALQGVEPDEAQALAVASRMLAVAPVLVLLGLVGYAVMLGAICRAVLQPDERRFGYLRFGRRELWLLLTMVVWAIVICLIYMGVVLVASLVGGVLGGITSGVSGGPEANPFSFLGPFFLVVVAGVLFMLWVMLRLSLALPMSHDQARFVLFESWRLTRGQSLKMLGVGLVLVLLAWLFELVVAAVAFGAMIGGAGGFEAFVSAPDGALAERLAPWIPVFALAAAVFGVLVFTVVATPIADIYRQLTATPEATDELRASV